MRPKGHDGGTMVAPTRGGGVTALWRMTGLLSASKKGAPPANSAGGGWSDKEIDALLGYSYVADIEPSVVGPRQKTKIHNFDVVVLRVMHGWMKVEEITYERLVEAIQLCHEILGADTVLLMTVPFTNNCRTPEIMRQVNNINEDIRKIAQEWHKEPRGPRHVLVQEYGTYYNHILWSNARHLGYSVTPPLQATQQVFNDEGPFFLLDRLKSGTAWPPSMAMVCSDTTLLGKNRSKCNRNYLFSDGMHICPERLASRWAAGIACLIGCAHNRKNAEQYADDIVADTSNNQRGIRACERECNEQFLSVIPIDESWIDTDTTLASFPE